MLLAVSLLPPSPAEVVSGKPCVLYASLHPHPASHEFARNRDPILTVRCEAFQVLYARSCLIFHVLASVPLIFFMPSFLTNASSSALCVEFPVVLFPSAHYTHTNSSHKPCMHASQSSRGMLPNVFPITRGVLFFKKVSSCCRGCKCSLILLPARCKLNSSHMYIHGAP
jgi:hypothetical protein